METASWHHIPAEFDDTGELWQLVADDGSVLWETDSRPSKACSREAEREFGITVQRPG